MECMVKHSAYQVPDEEFKCPKCGATPDDRKPFCIYEPVEETYDCEKLHDNDALYCENCNYSTTGKEYSQLMLKRSHRQICPTCKGQGWIG
jgi:hypothetical protein